MRKTRRALICLLALVMCLALTACGGGAAKAEAYDEALSLMDTGNYAEAIAAFEALGGYKDAAEKAQELKDSLYQDAASLLDAGSYAEAISAFEALGDYEGAAEKAQELKDSLYQDAVDLLELAAGGIDDFNFYSVPHFTNMDPSSQEKYLDLFAKYYADMPSYETFSENLYASYEYYEDGVTEFDETPLAMVDATYRNTALELAHSLFRQLGDYKDSAGQLGRFIVLEDVPLWALYSTDNSYYESYCLLYSADGAASVPGFSYPWAFDWEAENYDRVEHLYSDDGRLEKENLYTIWQTQDTWEDVEELAQVRTYTYDGSGNLTDITSQDFASVLWAKYYPDEVRSTDIAETNYALSYGENGQLAQVVVLEDSDKENVFSYEYSYDENGRLTEVRHIWNSYDEEGNLVPVYDGLMDTYSYSYDEAGNLAAIVKQYQHFYGIVTYLVSCDGQGRPVEVIKNVDEGDDSALSGTEKYTYGYGDYYFYS